MLTFTPGLERIHLLAHSRGTDVCTSALRELCIERRASGADPGSMLKIGNLVLAAPDMDMEVVRQRVAAEHIFLEVERFTIYVNKTDKALGLAEWLFSSMQRTGLLSPEEMPEKFTRQLGSIPTIQFVDAKVEADFFGHSYFYESPAVCSDLILVLRDDLAPGRENGRPLKNLADNFWRIDEEYPDFTSKQ